MKLTSGKKIGPGIASLLLILGLTGACSVVKMNEAVVGARYLSEDYIPELDIADKLQRSIAAVFSSDDVACLANLSEETRSKDQTA